MIPWGYLGELVNFCWLMMVNEDKIELAILLLWWPWVTKLVSGKSIGFS